MAKENYDQRKNHIKKESVRGSMTVEITLLMPMIIGVFLFLFFTLYYLHDVVAINKGVSTALLRGSLELNEDVIFSEMKGSIDDIRLLGKWELLSDISITNDDVSVFISGEMEATEGLFRKIIVEKYEYTTEGREKRIDEVGYVRSHR